MTTQPTTTIITLAVLELLIEQVRAEAEAATLEALSAKDGITVLHPVDPTTRHVRAGSNSLVLEDKFGYSENCWLYHDRESVRGNRPLPYWLISAERVGSDGHLWSRSLGVHIVDDFGTLVPVGR